MIQNSAAPAARFRQCDFDLRRRTGRREATAPKHAE